MNIDKLCLGCMNDIGDEQICAHCGYDNSVKNPQYTLPAKIFLAERYIVGSVKKQNAEGITYIGWDKRRETAVNIREYFPKNAANRNPDRTVSPIVGKKFVYNEGLLDFLELNRKLKEAKISSTPEIYEVFEENGTAYCISAPISGVTLKAFLEKNGRLLKWEQVRSLFLPFIDTVGNLHDIGIIHGGISPESIIVGRDGKLRLTDISIKKTRIVGGGTEVDIMSGFAAIEQYGVENIPMGPYTDVYGLSAVLFNTLIGDVPPSSMDRLENDTLTIPSKFASELPRQVLVSLANGLQIDSKNRTESIDEFKNELFYGDIKDMEPAHEEEKEHENNKPAVKPVQGKKGSTLKYVIISSLATLAVIAVIGTVLSLTVFKDILFPTKNEPADSSSQIPDAPSASESLEPSSETVTDENDGLYSVPNLLGKYYSEVTDKQGQYANFTFKIIGKDYSDKYAKDQILYQNLKEGDKVEDGAEIEIRLSLGAHQTAMPNVVGLDETSAKLEILKKGFSYDNIEVVAKYDSEAKPGVVLEQSPVSGEETVLEGKIKIYINSYTGE